MNTGDLPPDSAAAREAERQRSLLAALWSTDAGAAVANLSCREGPVSVARGLMAYRTNAAVHAARALEATYPTIQALVGVDDFRRLAREHWLQAAPTLGDLAEWGATLADWLEAHPALADWPYLGDCARLDWAVHRCERAADAAFDAESIARLGDTDPHRLHLQLRPGVAVIRSRWPVVLFHETHRLADPTLRLDELRLALYAELGESALVCRSSAGTGWRAQVHRVDAATTTWTERLLAGDSLIGALGAVSDVPNGPSGPAFDLAIWLAAALREGWLKGIRVETD